MDETYIGGKARNMHPAKRARGMKRGRSLAGKVAVMGLLERHWQGQAPRADEGRPERRGSISSTREIVEHVEDGSTVYTDALRPTTISERTTSTR